MELETIEQLAEVLNRSTLTRLEVEGENWGLQLERPPAAPVPTAPAAGTQRPAEAGVPREEALPDLTHVESPMVGVFHEAMPPVVAGQTVRAGEILGSIEALALRNEVRSPVDGEVSMVHVEDGQPVEYGQPLFTVGRFEGER